MPRRSASPRPSAPRSDALAEPLHRHALHLLRLVRREDLATGISAARLSALSVLVFGGPSTLGTLAAAEQVSAPTMTRLVQQLEREGWVRRTVDPDDARVARVAPTAAAVRLLHQGRERRLVALTRGLSTLGIGERAAIRRALPALDHLVRELAAPESGRRARGIRAGRRRLD